MGIFPNCNVWGQTRIEHIFEKSIDSKVKLPFFTHYGDVTDINNLVMSLR